GVVAAGLGGTSPSPWARAAAAPTAPAIVVRERKSRLLTGSTRRLDGLPSGLRVECMPSLPFRTTAGTSDGLSGSSRQSEVRRSNWALTATTIVLRDIKTAPTAGWRSIPHGASTPAARGMAATL